MIGVGKKTEVKLKELGINTIGDIVKNAELILERFGRFGEYYVKRAHGIDDRPLRQKRDVKSMSRERTFRYDQDSEEDLFPVLEELAERVHKQLLEEKMLCKTIGVKARYQDFKTHTKEISLPSATNSYPVIIEIQKTLLKEFLSDKRKIRLIGSRVSGLIKGKQDNQLLLKQF